MVNFKLICHDRRNVSSTIVLGVLQSDGTLQCKVCEGFFCSGIIPMKEHIAGQKHEKNVNQQKLLESKESKESIPVEARFLQLSLQDRKTAQQTVKEAWDHTTVCNYQYEENFITYSVDRQLEALSPHFAFIPHDEPIPLLNDYLL